jgi:hypothetical protein
VQKIVLIDYNEEKLPRTKKKKKDNPYKDMLKPDIIRACKEKGLPFMHRYQGTFDSGFGEGS